MIGVFIPWTDRSNSPGYVIDGNGCHIWVGASTGDGYGHVRIAGVLRSVHVVRYEREVGPVPEGMVLDHYVCDNRGCCNPAHVRPATNRENVLRGDGPTSINAAKTHCPRGHALEGSNVVGSEIHRGRECRTCKLDRQRRYRERVRLGGVFSILAPATLA